MSSCFPHKVLVFLHSQSLSVQISCQVINLHEAQVHSGHSGLFYSEGVAINYQSTTDVLVAIGDKHKVLVFLHSQSLSVQISCQVINLHEAQVHSAHSGLFHFKRVST